MLLTEARVKLASIAGGIIAKQSRTSEEQEVLNIRTALDSYGTDLSMIIYGMEETHDID